MKSFRIKNIEVEGFRGINKRIPLNLDKKPVLLFGINGSGKTSILQAVEWGLFGQLPYMSGGEFTKEDAIVNAFHPGKNAMVELILEDDEGTILKVKRTRKMYKSTTKGESDLTVHVNGEEYTGNDAQNKIIEMIALNLEEFYAGIHLHQEAIRDIILGDPLERSRTIDKLLGLYRLRELIEALPLSYVKREANKLGDEAETLKKTKIQATIISRKRLSQHRENLIKSGIPVEELDLTFLATFFNQIKVDISSIADEVGAKVEEVKPPEPTITSTQSRLSEAKTKLQELDKQKFDVYKKLQSAYSQLKSVRDDLKEAIEEVSKLEVKDPSVLSEKRGKIEGEISSIGGELEKKRSLRDFLQREKITVEGLLKEIQGFQTNIENIQSKYGDESVIEKSLKEMTEKIEGEDKRIKQQGTYNQLITLGIDYLQQFKPETCPVCKSSVKYDKIAKDLQAEITKIEEAKLLQKLHESLKRLQDERKGQENVLKELKELNEKLSSKRSQIEDEKQKISKEIGLKPTEPIDEFLGVQLAASQEYVKKIETRAMELEKQKLQIDSQLTDLKKKIGRLSLLESQAQKAINTTETGEKLLDLMKKEIDAVESKIQRFEALGKMFDSAREKIGKFEKIVNYLVEKDELEKLERELPEIEERVKELEKKHLRLKELEIGLIDIHKVATSEQKSLVQDTLASLQSVINTYYSKILGHPYYINLQLTPEEIRGKYIYWVKAFSKDYKHSTYVPTRFSNAQMNAAAVSLFFSMSKKLPHNLGIVFLDDPTQSMDASHKEALASLISEEIEEKQVIVATQDEELKNQIIKKSREIKVINFKEWSSEQGPLIEL